MPRTKNHLFSILFLSLLFYYSCSVSEDSLPDTWVTFRVDMSNETISANGVHIAGNMVSTNGTIEEMLDLDNDGIYEVSLSCTIGDTVEYMYLNRVEIYSTISWCEKFLKRIPYELFDINESINKVINQNLKVINQFYSPVVQLILIGGHDFLSIWVFLPSNYILHDH